MEKEKIVFKGSHPDSLYRVPAGSGAGAGKMGRALRLVRWPITLVGVCIALAVFVYFLMPDNFQSGLTAVNATYWETNVADADTHRAPEHTAIRPERIDRINKPDTRTPEIDFYDADINKNDGLSEVVSAITDRTPQRKPPVPPVFPTHLTPEVQYGNENADTGNLRSPKIIHQANSVTSDSTLKPHITQKPEKPLAIYFKDGEGVTTTTTTEAASKATILHDYINYGDQETNNKNKNSYKPYPGLVPWPDNKDKTVDYDTEPIIPSEIQEYYKRIPLKSNVNFTSGHSNLFGISIEDAEKMQSTTQSSVYNTRVSPTLPTWRDGDDTTTKKYPVHANADVSQCRSTSLPFCRGVLPYDLASKPVIFGSTSIRTLLPHIEYVAASNCSARFRSFVCALLEPECSPSPQPPQMPCYSFCRAIVDGCESEFPRELRTVFKCERYSSANCVAARVPCTPRELACGDGTCIPRDWICDGANDCPLGEDETQCQTCDATEFRCKSGTCIHQRWLCDGYADCPDGDDEARADCAAGDEPAGSAPAPSVARPRHAPARHRSKAGDYESSKELLMTSESSNSLKRNFTRRPPLSRLSPYSPPMLQDPHIKQKKLKVEENIMKKDNNRPESIEDVNVDDLGFSSDTLQENVDEKLNNQSKVQPMEGLAPMPRDEQLYLKESSTVPATKLDKTIKKMELVIDGKSLWRKNEQAAEPTEDYPESIENSTTFEKQEYLPKASGSGASRSEDQTRTSAHASPCPSGELRCVDGRCITLAQLCDGTIDCSDHADEDNCYT